jgi:hypothetical protein
MHAEGQPTTSRRAALACLSVLAMALCLLALVGRGPAASPTLAAAAGGATPISDEQPIPPTMTPTLTPTSTPPPTATATPTNPVVVTALDPRLTLIPSATTTARFRVANTGVAPVSVIITAACSQPEWCVGPIELNDGEPIANPVPLGAGQSIVVRLPIAIPAEARLDEHATLRILADNVN